MFLIDWIKGNSINKYFDISYDLKTQIVSHKLLQILKLKNQANHFLNRLKEYPKSQFQILRKLTLCSILLLYSKQNQNLVLEYLNFLKFSKIRIHDLKIGKIITIQIDFLRQICIEQGRLNKIKTFNINDEQISSYLQYCIIKCNQLFQITQNFSYLGRYYKQKGKKGLCNFVQMIGLQIKTFYLCIKNILGRILLDSSKYLQFEAQQQQFSYILNEVIPRLNDKLAYLFLNKYFPICHKIGLNTFKPTQLYGQMKQNYQRIVQDKNRSRRKSLRSIVNTTRDLPITELLITMIDMEGEIYGNLDTFRNQQNTFRNQQNSIDDFKDTVSTQIHYNKLKYDQLID